mgnify:CR=1 FL=1
MKPIRLQFSGLNSYRTQQEVNFQTLGADGLFGIFGPTGSGKSSILDAITLALYGGVDRASNNTRGIIHQLEKSLEVAFQFQLGEECFLVERRYERSPKDPEAAMAKQARLRKLIPGGESVLASKPQEVTARIEEILGIGKDEFSRAVVLPQGKFDRFLRLTGGERAAMLEHLFNLEQYGEALVAKVKQETANITEQLQRIDGEELGLGDCSEEAVNQAVLDLKSKNDQFHRAQKDLEMLERSYKEAEAVRELYLKRKVAREKLNRLESGRETMGEKQTRLDAAEQAEPLRELLARQRELRHGIEEYSISYQKKVQSHTAAVRGHEAAQKALEIAEKDYQEQLPMLQELKAIYQGAQEKEEKIKDIQPNLDGKSQGLEVLKAKIGATEKEAAEYQRIINNTRESLRTLHQERSKLDINPEEKEALERALAALVDLEESEKRYQESKESYLKRKSQNDTLWAELVKEVHQMLPDQPITAGDDLEKFAKSLLNQVEKELEEARKLQRKALIANSAVDLVKELHDGKPCPVCGSLEHPLPAKASGEMEKIDSKVKIAEDRLREIRNWEGRLLKAWHGWSVNETLVNEARELMDKSEKDLRVTLTAFEKARGTYQRGQLRIRKQELVDFEKRLHIIDQKRDELQNRLQDLTEDFQKLNESLQNDKIKEASLQEALKSLQIQARGLKAELDQITGGKDLKELVRELVKTYEKLQATVQNCKGKEGETRNALEKVAREIAAVEATLAVSQEELVGVEQRLALALDKAGFSTSAAVEAVLLDPSDRQSIRRELEQYRQEIAVSQSELEQLDREIKGWPFEEAIYEELKVGRESALQKMEHLKTETALAKKRLEELQEKQARWNELQKQKVKAEKRKILAEDLMGLLRGRRFVSFLAQEHLRDMTLEASYQLGRLTGQRYALELDKDKDCEFVIRDDYNGGARRTINSLSGGEIFMTSLALALALSSKIQLRGKYPLGFFFLDEGFGSLDQEKLDKVMSALEKLRDKHRIVGVISHVRELKERLPRYLEVVPAGEDGSGSRIKG